MMLDRWPIRMRLVALVVAVAAPLVVLDAYHLYNAATEQIAREAAASTRLAQKTAQFTAYFVDQTRLALESLARHQTKLFDPKECAAAAAALVALRPQYGNLAVRDRNAQVLCFARPDLGAPAQVIDPASFERALRENRFVVGVPLIAPASGRWVVIVRQPLRDEAGSVIGVISLSLDLVNLRPLVVDENAVPGSVITVTQRDGIVLARSLDAPHWVGRNVSELGVAAAILQRGQGQLTGLGADGVERVYGYAPLPELDWTVSAGIPTAGIYAPLRRTLWRSVAILLAVVAAVAALGFAVIRSIALPIRALAHAAEEVAAGRTGARAPLSGGAELALVAGRFNEMLDAQQAALAALRASERVERESHARFRTVFRAAPLPMSVTSRTTGALLDVNDAFCTQFGYAREEAIGRTSIDLGLWFDPAERETIFERLRGNASVRNFDARCRVRSGEVRDMLLNTDPIEFARERCYLATLCDVTERVQALAESEASRIAKDEAQASDRLKSAFLATMSHELRTPLNSIIGFTGILLQGLPGPLNNEQEVQMTKVRDSARHLLALINDVLDISKIEAGQLDVARLPFDLRASIAKVAAIVRPLAETKGLALDVEVACGVDRALGDARRAEQVLLNLLGNAIKFTERGAVTLRAAAADGGTIRVDVADTGIGIAAADLPKLFQPFRQIDSRLSRSHEGTGLGLAIARRLAQLMGGDITVASTLRAGSVFSLSLAATQESPP